MVLILSESWPFWGAESRGLDWEGTPGSLLGVLGDGGAECW